MAQPHAESATTARCAARGAAQRPCRRTAPLRSPWALSCNHDPPPRASRPTRSCFAGRIIRRGLGSSPLTHPAFLPPHADPGPRSPCSHRAGSRRGFALARTCWRSMHMRQPTDGRAPARAQVAQRGGAGVGARVSGVGAGAARVRSVLDHDYRRCPGRKGCCSWRGGAGPQAGHDHGFQSGKTRDCG